MRLYSLGFLFLLLPLSAGLYYLVPNRYKNWALLAVSCAFYYLMEPFTALWMAASVLADYACVALIYRYKRNRKRQTLLVWFAALKNLTLLAVFGVALPFYSGIFAPLGLAVVLVTSTSYLVDLYRGEVARMDGLAAFGVYCLFFGKLPIGPLVGQYRLMPQLKAPRPSLTEIGQGVFRCTVGIAKQAILARGMLSLSHEAVFAGIPSVMSSWLAVAGMALGLCFTLSAYSDLANGLGLVFSLKLPRTTYYPLAAKRVGEFVYRLHMPLGDFLRKYLLALTGGEKNLAYRFLLCLSPLLLVLWLRPSLGMLLWGGWLSLVLSVEQLFIDRIHRKAIPFLSRTATLILVVPSFALLLPGSAVERWNRLLTLFGLAGAPLYNDQANYLFLSNALLIVLALLCCCSVLDRGPRLLAKKLPAFYSFGASVFYLVLIVITASFLLQSAR